MYTPTTMGLFSMTSPRPPRISNRDIKVFFPNWLPPSEPELPAIDENANVKLFLNVKREFYVPGNTISGKIVLSVSSASYSLKSIFVALMCFESVPPDKKWSGDLFCGGSQSYHKVEPVEDLATLLAECNASGCGQFESEFNIFLDPDLTATFPPTLSLAKSPSHGIVWTVHARAEFTTDGSEKCSRIVEDSFPIEFHPTSPKEALLRHQTLNGMFGLATIICPYYLPQRPATSLLELHLLQNQEHDVVVHLEKRIIVASASCCAFVLTERSLLGEANKVTVDKINQKIFMEVCLKKREQTAFVSDFYTVNYQICVRITVGSRSCERSYPVDVAPPF